MELIPSALGAARGFFQAGGLSTLIKGTDGLSLLTTGATALTAMSQYSAGLANKNEALAQADREELGARQEILRGKQSGNEILDRLVDTLAKNRVIQAGSGTSSTIGTPAAIARDTRQRGERAIGIEQQNAAIQWFTRKQSAAAMRARGKAYGLEGLLAAGGTTAQGLLQNAQRG